METVPDFSEQPLKAEGHDRLATAAGRVLELAVLWREWHLAGEGDIESNVKAQLVRAIDEYAMLRDAAISGESAVHGD